ncbi:MAG: hypothetical protein L6Q98_04265 [Anaerolineae bacterium]|nr:hypothetical protein [Anaerolineae bacterium]NUQ03807.1 hypothetical protein [Anaerolineae bacterium]
MAFRDMRSTAYVLIWLSLAGLMLYSGTQVFLSHGADSVVGTIALLPGLAGMALILARTGDHPLWRDSLTRWAWIGWGGLALTAILEVALGGVFSAIRLHLALPISLAPPLYWLYRRFSNVSAAWTINSLRSALLLLMVSGAARLFAESHPAEPALRPAFALIAILCLLIVGAHSMLPQSDRNPSRVMAAPWAAQAMIWLILGGSLSAGAALPGLSWARHPLLDQAVDAALMTSAWCVLLGIANQAAAELRGQNRRVTGWIPFWLIFGGALLIIAGLAAAGLLTAFQAALPGGTPVRADLDGWGAALLEPFAAFWRVGGVLTLTGALIFALTYFLRRPRPIR